MKSQTSFKLSFIILLGAAASIANNGIMWLTSIFSLGLYLDTIFTISVVFLAGLLPGIICAILTTFIYSFIYFLVWGTPYYWVWYFYIICSIAAVLLVKFFARYFPEEYKIVQIGEKSGFSITGKQQFFGIIIMLTILSVVMCILMSVLGGLISAAINMSGNDIPQTIPPETWLRMGFIRQGFSLFASEILGRIPVNMADRPISVFIGYAAAFLIKKLFTRFGKAFAAKLP